MAERLLHYSAKPFTGPLRDVDEHPLHFKPSGLWVSVEGEDDWPDWCHAEDWGLDRLRYAHEVALAPEANLLRLTTPADIDRLTAEHGIDPLSKYHDRTLAWTPSYTYIDWPAIAARHDGIVIAPYQPSRRLAFDAMWYYAWDCASGCIWRARAVAGVSLIGEVANG